jgi:2-polyprenyl-6-methoxyphenol hydroxylase-like FAD-dependent oxidoreductase
VHVLVAGGGPVGVFTAIALARRDHEVTLVDRDPGPAADGSWVRRGVMQAEHPHSWRPGVRRALLAEMPDVYDAMIAAGARTHVPHGVPEELTERLTAMSGRRTHVFERVLREAATRQPNLQWRTGHVDELMIEDDTLRGVQVDGDFLAADVVIVATGRTTGLGEGLRGPVEGGACGFAYVSRMYQARAGQRPYDLPTPSLVDGPGYVSLVLGQDAGTHSVLVAYPLQADEFRTLRTEAGFERAARAIPNLAPWVEPGRFEPITNVMVGGNLTNTYRRQGPALGVPPARGLFFVGDTVLTTNPAGGRNVALLLGQVQHLLGVLDDPGRSLVDASLALDTWAEQNLRPWFLDHVHKDRTQLERFAGRDIDLDERIPSDVICAAAEVDESLRPIVGIYQGMLAGPEVLNAAEGTVRALLEQGWRPTMHGPTGAELAALLTKVGA